MEIEDKIVVFLLQQKRPVRPHQIAKGIHLKSAMEVSPAIAILAKKNIIRKAGMAWESAPWPAFASGIRTIVEKKTK